MMYNGSAVFSQTGGENFIATKTISETFYGGTSYTAWNMERVSNLQQAFSRIAQVPNLNIGTWQITSALTNANGTFQNYNQYAGKQLIDQDLGHWNVTGMAFGPLHELFQKNYDDHFIAQDELAERIKAIGGHANGELGKMVKDSKVLESDGKSDDKSMIKMLAEAETTVAATCLLYTSDAADE